MKKNNFRCQNVLFVLIVLLLHSTYSHAQNNILVLSGGGARGAWGGGVLQGLRNGSNITFRTVIGTSTGTLLAPLTLLGSTDARYFDTLRYAYEDVDQSSIFNVNPFVQKGAKAGQPKIGLAIERIILGKQTLGESEHLKKRITTFYSPQAHAKILSDSMEFIATVLNMDLGKVEYKSSKQLPYEEMVNWMWASANEPIFMSLYQDSKTNHHYIDGGLKEALPIQHAMDLAVKANKDHIPTNDVDTIYVIINNDTIQENDWSITTEGKKIKILNSLFRTLDIMKTNTRQYNLEAGQLRSMLSAYGVLELSGQSKKFDRVSVHTKKIELIIYCMSPDDVSLIPNELMFDKVTMETLWKRGLAAGHAKVPVKRFTLYAQ